MMAMMGLPAQGFGTTKVGAFVHTATYIPTGCRRASMSKGTKREPRMLKRCGHGVST